MASRTIKGAKASFKLDGKKIAFAGGCTVTIENTQQRIDVVDEIASKEIALVRHAASVNVQVFKATGSTALDIGLENVDKNTSLAQKEFVFEIYDREHAVTIVTLTGAVFESGSGEINAAGVWTGSWTFQAREAIGA